MISSDIQGIHQNEELRTGGETMVKGFGGNTKFT